MVVVGMGGVVLLLVVFFVVVGNGVGSGRTKASMLVLVLVA